MLQIAERRKLYRGYKMTNCGICQAVAKEATLLTTDYWVVNLAPDQGYLGRAHVTLREHKANLSDLSDEEWVDYKNIVRRLETACSKGLGATLFNWSCLMNNAYQQKPYNAHVHWHFRPRYKSSITLNELIFEDPQFGFHYDREQRRTVDDETFRVIIEKVKTCL
jgi:diadenosine tetraphosphate (Ap4A) HIT family hydrolase